MSFADDRGSHLRGLAARFVSVVPVVGVVPVARVFPAGLAMLVASVLLAPPLVLPLAASPVEAAPCCCGGDGASCLCAYAPGGGCRDDRCRLDEAPVPADAADLDNPAAVRLDLPSRPSHLAPPPSTLLPDLPSAARSTLPAPPPETPPPRP